MVFPDEAVRFELGRNDLVARQLTRQIDGRGVYPKMETDCTDAEQAIDCRRQHMLPRVLLHVIEAARPVDRAVDGLTRSRRVAVDDVRDLAGVVVDDVKDS